ncbi:N-6 DNA methylase [Sorangium cellulosum]|uniref:N-6 DNA methylase n=1 Tax=Sorangium cellulosum TaxID=56 RepID=UPI000428ED1E|nr:N-6 DNA methylase [Sorangium cellulosum]
MLTTDAVRRTQRALSDPSPDRCFQALEALGWSDGDATVVWSPERFGLGQCHLGAYPTGASVTRETAPQPTADSEWWKKPYYGDYRWGLLFDHGRIRWCDLLGQKQCTVLQQDLTAEVLQGLTPESFASQGQLELLGVQASPLPNHRGKRAADYFSSMMESWFEDYLAASGADEDSEAKERFTRIISAFILLRTIEDVNRLDWLMPGALRSAARKGERALRELLGRAAKELNSRVLHGIADLLPATSRVRNLVEAFYQDQEDVRFSTLEADPVGAFYQNLLGTRYDVRPPINLNLFGENNAIVPDRSARKRSGAYFTPREYADLLATRLVLPAARNARTKDELPIVMDLAAGSGQLLCAALRQIFSLPRWRNPEVAIHVLERCIWAVDDDKNAPQFTALNVLRTVVQFVPDILGSGLKFPSLEKNVRKGNALQKTTLEELPDADVVLLNPPFHGAKRWREWMPPEGALEDVESLAGKAHSAFAFCLAGLTKLRAGGDLGILMTSQPILGDQSRAAREAVGRHFRIETVVINEVANVLDREKSYLSVVLGHKAYDVDRPGTQVISVVGGKGADIGALAAGAWSERSNSHAALVMLSDERPWDWTGQEAITSRQSAMVMRAEGHQSQIPRVRLSDLLGEEIHQPVSCAPKPWERELFLFRMTRPDVLRHEATHQEIRGTSASLRRVSIPNLLRSVPPFLEPFAGRSGELRVFFPGDGSPDGILWRGLRRSDPVGYKIAKLISRIVLDTPPKDLNDDALAFQEDVKRGILRFSWNRGYTSDSRALLLLSRSPKLPTGKKHELIWPCWIDPSGSAVPLGGSWVRVSKIEWAIAIGVMLNVPDAVMTILRSAPKRDETTEPTLRDKNAWLVPDLRDARCSRILRDLEQAYAAYQRACKSIQRGEALKCPELAHLLELGGELWRL